MSISLFTRVTRTMFPWSTWVLWNTTLCAMCVVSSREVSDEETIPAELDNCVKVDGVGAIWIGTYVCVCRRGLLPPFC